jgi:hypothetical protein
LIDSLSLSLSHRFTGKKYETKQLRTKSIVKRLKIKGFDEDQIWEEIQLQNKPLTNWIENKIELLLKEKDSINFDFNDELEFNGKKRKRDEESDALNDEQKEENGHNQKKKMMIPEDLNEKIDVENNVTDQNSLSESSTSKNKKKNRKKSSILDDKFFRLDEMEEFVRQAEKVQFTCRFPS